MNKVSSEFYNPTNEESEQYMNELFELKSQEFSEAIKKGDEDLADKVLNDYKNLLVELKFANPKIKKDREDDALAMEAKIRTIKLNYKMSEKGSIEELDDLNKEEAEELNKKHLMN
jgi:hypothetical protein